MAAPKGNQFGIGNNGGHPPHYETPEELNNKIEEYFETSKNGSGKYQPTIEGLTYHLGFADRRSLIDQTERSKEFSHVIGRAKTFIKSCYERNLYGFAWAGASFALRNLGKNDWKERVENDVTHTNLNVAANFGATIPTTQEPSEDTPLDK